MGLVSISIRLTLLQVVTQGVFILWKFPHCRKVMGGRYDDVRPSGGACGRPMVKDADATGKGNSGAERFRSKERVSHEYRLTRSRGTAVAFLRFSVRIVLSGAVAHGARRRRLDV